MLKIKEIAATLAILGSGALAVSACNKDKQAIETPEAAGGGDAAGAKAGAEKAEGSCGGAAEGSCGGDHAGDGEKAKGEGEKAEGDGEKAEGSCGAGKDGEASCGAGKKPEGGG